MRLHRTGSELTSSFLISLQTRRNLCNLNQFNYLFSVSSSFLSNLHSLPQAKHLLKGMRWDQLMCVHRCKGCGWHLHGYHLTIMSVLSNSWSHLVCIGLMWYWIWVFIFKGNDFWHMKDFKVWGGLVDFLHCINCEVQGNDTGTAEKITFYTRKTCGLEEWWCTSCTALF